MERPPVVFVVGENSSQAGRLLKVVRSDAPLRIVESLHPQDDALPSDTDAIIIDARLFADLRRSAITDPLTGLYNARFFQESLTREVARSDRYGTPLSLLMIDVDGFKNVNDTMGHLAGDRVLAAVASAIQQSVRATDVVFRCGGDEFGVILPGTTIEGATCAGGKIVDRVASEPILAEYGLAGSITVSVGAAELHKDNGERLLSESDRALYESKRASKNCVRAYDDSV